MTPNAWILTGLFAIATLSGCVYQSESAFEETHGGAASPPAHPDRTYGFGRRTSGHYDSVETIDVPAGASGLEVDARWNVAGDASFELRDPDGRLRGSDTVSGSESRIEKGWFQSAAPAPGEWKLSIRIQGAGDFAFDVRVRGR